MEFKTDEYNVPVVWLTDDGFAPGVFQNVESAHEYLLYSMKEYEKRGYKVEDWETGIDGNMSCWVTPPRSSKSFRAYCQLCHVVC